MMDRNELYDFEMRVTHVVDGLEIDDALQILSAVTMAMLVSHMKLTEAVKAEKRMHRWFRENLIDGYDRMKEESND